CRPRGVAVLSNSGRRPRASIPEETFVDTNRRFDPLRSDRAAGRPDRVERRGGVGTRSHVAGPARGCPRRARAGRRAPDAALRRSWAGAYRSVVDLLPFDERLEVVEGFFETLGVHALDNERISDLAEHPARPRVLEAL